MMKGCLSGPQPNFIWVIILGSWWGTESGLIRVASGLYSLVAFSELDNVSSYGCPRISYTVSVGVRITSKPERRTIVLETQTLSPWTRGWPLQFFIFVPSITTCRVVVIVLSYSVLPLARWVWYYLPVEPFAVASVCSAATSGSHWCSVLIQEIQYVHRVQQGTHPLYFHRLSIQ
jgi:hypothetical protein